MVGPSSIVDSLRGKGEGRDGSGMANSTLPQSQCSFSCETRSATADCDYSLVLVAVKFGISLPTIAAKML